MIGKTVGKYRILERLGRGGMGIVYKALDETLDREVAIKVLNPDLSDAELLKRFRAEAISLARLNHPFIATIYELHRHEDDLLMVMEFVRGETLQTLSERLGPLDPPQAAHVCVQVLDALSHAHRAGIVHRDLKPANVMLTDTGVVKVMDFGIARMMGGEHFTHAGYMMGTPAYMAPEQVLGQEIDGRADIYSVGVLFYRLLSRAAAVQGRHRDLDGAEAGRGGADAARQPHAGPAAVVRVDHLQGARQGAGRPIPDRGSVPGGDQDGSHPGGARRAADVGDTDTDVGGAVATARRDRASDESLAHRGAGHVADRLYGGFECADDGGGNRPRASDIRRARIRRPHPRPRRHRAGRAHRHDRRPGPHAHDRAGRRPGGADRRHRRARVRRVQARREEH